MSTAEIKEETVKGVVTKIEESKTPKIEEIKATEAPSTQVKLLGGKTINAGKSLVIFTFFTLELSYQRQNILRGKMPNNPTIDELIEFPWNSRWLRGYEYEFILKNYKLY